MNIYRSILTELSKVSSPKVRHNKLVELKYKTEDIEVINRIDDLLPLLRQLDDAIKRKLPSSASHYREHIKYIEEQLKVYCNRALSTEEPEWMIIAKRNGWAKIR